MGARRLILLALCLGVSRMPTGTQRAALLMICSTLTWHPGQERTRAFQARKAPSSLSSRLATSMVGICVCVTLCVRARHYDHTIGGFNPFTAYVAGNSTGGFVLEVHPSWAPLAVKRFRELVCLRGNARAALV